MPAADDEILGFTVIWLEHVDVTSIFGLLTHMIPTAALLRVDPADDNRCTTVCRLHTSADSCHVSEQMVPTGCVQAGNVP